MNKHPGTRSPTKKNPGAVLLDGPDPERRFNSRKGHYEYHSQALPERSCAGLKNYSGIEGDYQTASSNEVAYQKALKRCCWMALTPNEASIPAKATTSTTVKRTPKESAQDEKLHPTKTTNWR